MCMSTCPLSLSWSKEDNCFVGYGYKVINKYNDEYKPKGWLIARGVRSRLLLPSKRKIAADKRGHAYWPGFHIFVDLKSAVNCQYLHKSYIRNDKVVIKVKYTNVTGYGTNETMTDENRKWKPEPCVVAQNMMIVEKIPYKDYKHLLIEY